MEVDFKIGKREETSIKVKLGQIRREVNKEISPERSKNMNGKREGSKTRGRVSDDKKVRENNPCVNMVGKNVKVM